MSLKKNAFCDAVMQAKLLYTFEQVNSAIDRCAVELNENLFEHEGDVNEKSLPLVILTVMNGGMIFSGMLIPKLNFLVELDYIHATRYGSNQEGGRLALLAEPKIELQNRRVLLVDDIFDDGITLARVKKYCLDRGADSVHSAVLVFKDKPRAASIEITPPEYISLTVPDEFVFGMGMDADGLYRNAPGIYYFPEKN